MARAQASAPPLVAHVVYRFAVGGLENGLVNLINHAPAGDYRHAIVSLTDVSEFAGRIRAPGVEIIALGKPPGHALALYPTLHRLFRRLAPSVVHTRNLAALETVVPAWTAGVPVRVHGEHGRDMHDLDGTSRKYQWLRRAYRPFVSAYIALSRDLEAYLRHRVGVPAGRIAQIYNGVDTVRFRPAAGERPAIPGCPFDPRRHWLVGTVGRMQAVKNQPLLARAFVRAAALDPDGAARLRLVMAGDGPLLPEVRAILAAAGLADRAWLPGERDDIPEILRGLDCFVLPSLAEGISNTILEAMASGLPVIATAVGGNPELVREGITGTLVPSRDVDAMARALLGYCRNPPLAEQHGAAGRAEAETRFSLEAMVRAYLRLYDGLLGRPVRPVPGLGVV